MPLLYLTCMEWDEIKYFGYAAVARAPLRVCVYTSIQLRDIKYETCYFVVIHFGTSRMVLYDASWFRELEENIKRSWTLISPLPLPIPLLATDKADGSTGQVVVLPRSDRLRAALHHQAKVPRAVPWRSKVFVFPTKRSDTSLINVPCYMYVLCFFICVWQRIVAAHWIHIKWVIPIK